MQEVYLKPGITMDIFIYLIQVGNMSAKDIQTLLLVNKCISKCLLDNETKKKLIPFAEHQFSLLRTANGIVSYLLQLMASKLNKHDTASGNKQDNDDKFVSASVFYSTPGTKYIEICTVNIPRGHFDGSVKHDVCTLNMNHRIEPSMYYEDYNSEDESSEDDDSDIKVVKVMDYESPLVDKLFHRPGPTKWTKVAVVDYYLDHIRQLLVPVLASKSHFGTDIIQTLPAKEKCNVIEAPFKCACKCNDRSCKEYFHANMLDITEKRVYVHGLSSYDRIIDFYIPSNITQLEDKSYKFHPYFANLYKIK